VYSYSKSSQSEHYPINNVFLLDDFGVFVLEKQPIRTLSNK